MQTPPQERCVALSGNIATPAATSLAFPPPSPLGWRPPPCGLQTCVVPVCVCVFVRLSFRLRVWGEMSTSDDRHAGYGKAGLQCPISWSSHMWTVFRRCFACQVLARTLTAATGRENHIKYK
ncbi:hypothetical protein E2C01_100818 [Portunus trituberculatus]|uniref:Uncharacterized protein n=1 Tax=Portunus trituberculatus TaxID=210409 RepID=A0A5B7K909_PORTR|nr:hypothetical protein [Portunus trituberculatus]